VFVLEKNCIFLKADESLEVFKPISSKFIKFKIFELSLGSRSKWDGVDVELLFRLFWWYFQRVFVFRWVDDEDEYFNEFPTTLEKEGFRL
jgi:hypothetical protein